MAPTTNARAKNDANPILHPNRDFRARHLGPPNSDSRQSCLGRAAASSNEHEASHPGFAVRTDSSGCGRARDIDRSTHAPPQRSVVSRLPSRAAHYRTGGNTHRLAWKSTPRKNVITRRRHPARPPSIDDRRTREKRCRPWTNVCGRSRSSRTSRIGSTSMKSWRKSWSWERRPTAWKPSSITVRTNPSRCACIDGFDARSARTRVVWATRRAPQGWIPVG